MPPLTEEQLKKAMGILGGFRFATNPQTGLPALTNIPSPQPVLNTTQPQTSQNAPQPIIQPKTTFTTGSPQTPSVGANLGTTTQFGSNLSTAPQTGLPSQFQQLGQLFGISKPEEFRQLLGIGLSPEEKQLREQAIGTIKKLSELQLQATQAGAPTQAMTVLDQLIGEQQKTLERLTPSEVFRTSPNLQQVGITQGQLERSIAAQREPITRGLADLLFSRSALGAQQQSQLQALQGQIGALGTQFELQQALSKLAPTPRLSESLTGKLLETALVPPTTDEIKEFNLAKQQGFTGSFLDYKKQTANLKTTAAGTLDQGTIDQYVKLLSQGQIGLQNVPANIRNIVVGRSSDLGTPILSPSFAKAAKEAQASFSSAQGQLNLIGDLANKVIGAQSVAGLPLQAVKSLPGVRIFSPDRKVYADTVDAFLSMLTRAAGEKGVLTNVDVARIKKALPSPFTDTIETANQKLQNFRALLESIRNGTVDAFTAQRFGITLKEPPTGTTGNVILEGKTSSGLGYRVVQ